MSNNKDLTELTMSPFTEISSVEDAQLKSEDTADYYRVKHSTLRASTNKISFAPTGGVQTVTIANSTKLRKALKVETSDNMLYRVNPVFGFVEPGDKLSIDVRRHNGSEKTDHLVVWTSDATSEQKCAKGVFETDPPRELTAVVSLVVH